MFDLKISHAIVAALCCVFVLPLYAEDDIDRLGLPVIETRGGFTLSVIEYEASTQHDLLDDDPAEHSVSLTGWLRAPGDKDVLCFATTLLAVSAEDDEGDELIVPKRKRAKEEYAAVLPSAKVNDREGEPIRLAEAELDPVDLRRPGYEIEELVVEARAVVMKETETAEMKAVVADRFIDVGHAHQVQVASMEVDKRGLMTVKLNVRRTGGTRGPVIESLYALNDRDAVIGGGRWTNELDLFANNYEVEMQFPLNEDKTAAKLRVVFATEYEIETIKFTIKKLYQK
ncbi:MAG: hypothetical protein ACE37H_14960 [Phycisphaeraceae bacterium]